MVYHVHLGQGLWQPDQIGNSCMPQLDIGPAHIVGWGNTWSALLELAEQHTALEGSMSTALVYIAVVAEVVGKSLHGTAVLHTLGCNYTRLRCSELHQLEAQQ